MTLLARVCSPSVRGRMLLNVYACRGRAARCGAAFYCAAVLLHIMLLDGAARADTVVLENNIREALKASAEQLGPLTVEWTWTVTRASVPIHKIERRVTWQDGKFHVVIHKLLPPPEWTIEQAFDGQAFFSDGAKHVPMGMTDGPLLYLEFFDCSGILVPTRLTDMMKGQAQSSVLRTLNDGGTLLRVEEAELDGHRVLRLDVRIVNEYQRHGMEADLAEAEKAARSWANTEQEVQRELDKWRRMRAMPTHLVKTFYLDPERGYALRRWEERLADGTLLVRCDADQLERVESRSLWLPRRCTKQFFLSLRIPDGFNLSETPLYTDVIEVTDIAVPSAADQTPTLDYTAPGTLIHDYTDPNAPSPLTQDRPATGADDMHPRHLVLALLIIVLLCLGAYAIWRRRKQRTALAK